MWPIKELKRNNLKGPKFSIRYWRISVTLGSGIAGFNCTFEFLIDLIFSRRETRILEIGPLPMGGVSGSSSIIVIFWKQGINNYT